MQRCDVLIVGGGPAGSTCAGELVRRGLDVIVADKAAFPRDKVCAGWITTAVVEELGLDPAAYGRGRTFEPIRSFLVVRMGDRPHVHHYDEPVSYGIRRCELDDYLLKRSGARLALGNRVTRIVRDGRRWRINDQIEADVLVGAGGHFCPVARTLGDEPDGARIAAEECEFSMEGEAGDCAIEAGVPELYFTRDLAGYGWAFRKGRFLNVGLGVRTGAKPGGDGPALRSRVDEFVQFLVDTGRLARRPHARMAGHAYLLCPDSRRRRYGDGFVLIGDAAGLAYDRSGEGIRCAVESGLLAAAAIGDVIARGSRGSDILAVYGRTLEQRYGASGEGRWNAADLIPEGLRRPLAAALMRSSWFSRRILLEQWFLHSNEQALSPVHLSGGTSGFESSYSRVG